MTLDTKLRAMSTRNDEMKRIILKQRENESKAIRINNDLKRGLDLASNKINEYFLIIKDL